MVRVRNKRWGEAGEDGAEAGAYECSTVGHLHLALENDVPGRPVKDASSVSGGALSTPHGGAFRGEEVVFEPNAPLRMPEHKQTHTSNGCCIGTRHASFRHRKNKSGQYMYTLFMYTAGIPSRRCRYA